MNLFDDGCGLWGAANVVRTFLASSVSLFSFLLTGAWCVCPGKINIYEKWGKITSFVMFPCEEVRYTGKIEHHHRTPDTYRKINQSVPQ